MKPIRNPGYLLRIRTLPCSVWLTTRAVEAAHNYRWPNPSCPAPGGTGRSARTTLVAGLDAPNGEIDELASTAGDICTPAKTLLDLAWWHRENAIRAGDGKVRNSQQTCWVLRLLPSLPRVEAARRADGEVTMMRKVRKQRQSNGPNDSARWSSGMWGGRPRPRGGPCLRLAQTRAFRAVQGGCPTIWSQREWLSEGDTQLRTNTLVASSSAHRYETTSNEPLEAMPVEIQRTSLPGRCLTTSPASPPLPPAALAVDPKLAESMNIP